MIGTMAPAAKPAPADHEIHQSYKTRMQRRVIGTLTFVALVYFFSLFPQQLIDSIQATFAARRAQWLNLTAGAGSNVTLVWVLSFMLFASDSAFKGSGRTAKWARSQFASRAAVEKFRCTDGQASALWFKFFDTWGLVGSPNRNLLINSYSATYAARAVFYLQRALIAFLFVSSLSMVLHWKLFHSYQGVDGSTRLVIHVLAVSLLAAGLTFLTLANRLPKGGAPATGCWARVQDVFDRSRTVFEHEILRHASTLEEAFGRVEALRRELIAADAT